MTASSLARSLDLLGVFVFAVSGASLAARKGFDVVGLVVLAVATGLGGGMVRDVLLGATPPVALEEEVYVVIAAVAAGVVLVAHRLVERAWRPVLAFDAVGLGVFAVAGAAKALQFGLGWVAAVVLGTVTAVGGGVTRDVMAREVPVVFRADSALYAIPAALGAALTVVVWELGLYGPPAAIAIGAAVLTVRLLSMRLGWRAPTTEALRRGR